MNLANHGKREHNDEVSCEDLLYKYEDEVKSMSKACFGIEKIFAKEIKRRNRLVSLLPNISVTIQFKEKTENEAQESGNFEVEENDLTGEELPEEDEEEKETEDLDPQDDHDHQQIYVPSNSSGTQKRKTRSMRRFGTRKPKSRKQKQEMAKLREISMHLGGGQYFKKRGSETVVCEQCGRIVNSRLSDHAYSHLDACALFKCMQCSLGHYSRETIVRHMKDLHGSVEPPIDNRLKFAKEIKRTIKECYPQYFVDSPVPTKETIDKLKATLKLSDKILTEDGDSTSDQIRGTPENDEVAGYEEDDIEGSDLDDDEHCQDDEDEQPDADEGNDDYEEFDDEDDIDK